VAAPPAAGRGAGGRGGGGGGGRGVLFPNNQTLRQIVRTSLGGDRLRIVLANTFGTAPLQIGAAHVALKGATAPSIQTGGRPLTFNGERSTTIPPGATVISDPIALTTPNFADVVIDLHLPGNTGANPSTTHRAAIQTSYLSNEGNFAGSQEFPVAATSASWYYLARVEVTAPERTPVIVALGDSITDGTASTVDTNNRWPNHLAKRLATEKGGRRIAVVNAGISGNRVLSDSTPDFGQNILARFDRDVLTQSGATHVVFMLGINDIGGARTNPSPSAADLIAGHRQVIARARAQGLKIFGATLTPFEGAAYFTPLGEEKRQAVNNWIRTSKEYDGVIDFDAATRDPKAPTKFLPAYDSGDHLHPSDAGYEAMAKSIDLGLFR
jgi:lysophospholipase L1-like esterase